MNNCCQQEKTQTDIDRRLSLKQLMSRQDALNELIQSGWKGVLSPDNFYVAMLDEMVCETLGSGINWKHWKFTDPSEFQADNLKIEITDATFFYLSLMIYQDVGVQDPNSAFCRSGEPFDEYDFWYVGADKGYICSDSGFLCGQNSLNHTNYMNLIRNLIRVPADMFDAVSVLDCLVSSIGLTSEEYSAYYVAKEVLNRFRQDQNYQGGTYEKIDIAGVEDNERIHPLVEDFMTDTSMTLDILYQNVIDEFYQEVTP